MEEDYPTDNGLSLGRHALVLFLSVTLSMAMHFGAFYRFGTAYVADASQTAQRAHLTPDTLPPVQIEAFVRQAALATATIARPPDVSAEADRTASALPEKAEGAKAPLPTLPALPPPQMPSAELTPLPVPALPSLPVRQDVAAVPDTEFTRTVNPDPLWTLEASVPRVPHAPDLASSVESATAPDALGSGMRRGTENVPGGLPVALPPATDSQTLDLLRERLALTVSRGTLAPSAPDTTASAGSAGAVSQTLEQLAAQATALPAPSTALPGEMGVVPDLHFQSIDDRLRLSLCFYDHPSEPDSRYFRLDIVRRPESSLPIMEKDVVFIQDISGSIGASRLEYCKESMKSALFNTLRTGDRFNIFAFRDVTLTPASGWLTFSTETRPRAETFINSLRAKGATDLFLLLQDLLYLPQDPSRPLIAVVVTDGEPTVGVTETTRIIGEFSRMNQGRISVYSFGAKKRDPYFLDMLCYANRGENTSASGRVADINRELKPIFEEIRNPVMKDLQLTFNGASGSDIHPRHLTNLYADRMLTVYGRVPRATEQVTCQLRGQSAAEPYDAVFTFDFREAEKSKIDLRKAWAERAMFDLLSEYAENPSEALLGRIAAFAQTYGVPNPYRQQ